MEIGKIGRSEWIDVLEDAGISNFITIFQNFEENYEKFLSFYRNLQIFVDF